jgi:protein-disulfide isomerase
MSRRAVAFAALLALVVAFAFAAAACGGDSDSPGGPPGTRTPTVPKPTTTGNTMVDRLATLDYPLELQDGTTLGKADAPVTIGMYEDFTCPHCLEFTAIIEPGLVEQLVKTGKAKLEFHYFPLRTSSVPAMIAAQCAAEQGQFWEYGRRLFKEQAIADAMPAAQADAALAAAFSTDKFKQYAADLGLDATAYAACLTGDSASARIAADSRLVEQYNMRGTPTFVVNGKAMLDGSPSTVADWVKLVENTK